MTVSGVFRTAIAVLTCAALAAGVQGCSDPPTGPSMIASFSQTDLTVGTGTAASPGNNLTVNYTGWLYDGSKPDAKGCSSTRRREAIHSSSRSAPAT